MVFQLLPQSKSMISSEAIEKYQEILRQNPNSQVFAPLADAFLEKGLFLQAEELALRGTERHPQFASGFVVLGKIQLHAKKLGEAESSLRKAIQVSPQNILAHQLLGDVYLEQKKPLEALKAFKMVLFLNPHSQRAKQAVEKLEAASALEFEEETFAMAKLSNLQQVQKNTAAAPDASASARERSRKMLLQLVDAFLIRRETSKAIELLLEMKTEHGSHPDIEARLKRAAGIPARTESPSQGSPEQKGKAPFPAANPQRTVPSEPSPNSKAAGGATLTARIAREKKLRKLRAMLQSVRAAQGLPPEPA